MNITTKDGLPLETSLFLPELDVELGTSSMQDCTTELHSQPSSSFFILVGGGGCMHVCTCTCVQTCVCIWRPEGHIGRHPQEYCLLLLRQTLSLAWSPTVTLYWMIRKPQESSYHCPLSAGIANICHHAQYFAMSSRDQPRVLTLARWARNHLPSPQGCYFDTGSPH